MGVLSSFRRTVKGGTGAYREFEKQRGQWVNEQLKKLGLKEPGRAPIIEGQGGEFLLTPEQQKQVDAARAKYPDQMYYAGDTEAYRESPQVAALLSQFNKVNSQAYIDYNNKRKQLSDQWITTLPPDVQQKVAKEFQLHSSDFDTVNKYGSLAAKSIIGAAAGGALATGSGLLGGASNAASGSGFIGEGAASGIPAWDSALTAAEAGVGGSGGLDFGLQNVNATNPGNYDQFIDFPGDANGSWDVPGNVGNTGAPNMTTYAPGSANGQWDVLPPASNSGGNWYDPILKSNAIPKLPNGDFDWLKFGLTYGPQAAGLLSGPSGSPPKPPNYTDLTTQQGEIDRQTAEYITSLNRVNQVNPYGSLTWSQDPKTGQWTQTVALSPEQQKLLNTQTQGQQTLADTGLGLLGGVQDSLSTPFSLKDAPQVSGYDLSKLEAMPDAGFGSVPEVQQAMLKLMQPGLDKAKAAQMQHLAAQGLTGGQEIWNDTMKAQLGAQTDAELKALLAGTTEYGNIYNRQLTNRQQGIAEQGLLRGASGEDQDRYIRNTLLERQTPLNEYTALMNNSQVTNPAFANYNSATPYQGPNIAGAGQQQYNANLGTWNAGQAAATNRQQGLFSLGNNAMRTFYG